MTEVDIHCSIPCNVLPMLPTRAFHNSLRPENRDSEPEPRKLRTFRDLTDHFQCPRLLLVHHPISRLFIGPKTSHTYLETKGINAVMGHCDIRPLANVCFGPTL